MLLMCCVTLGQSLNLSEPQSPSGTGTMIVLVGFSEKVFLWGPSEVLGSRLASSKGRANKLSPGFGGGGGYQGSGWAQHSPIPAANCDTAVLALQLCHYSLSVKSYGHLGDNVGGFCGLGLGQSRAAGGGSSLQPVPVQQLAALLSHSK